MNRRKKLLLTGRHILYFLILLLLCVLGCPIYRLFGIRCPGCGLTHAWLSFFAGDWARAFEYHFFFLPAPLFLLLVFHRDTDFLRKRHLSPFLYAYAAVIFVYHILRTVT